MIGSDQVPSPHDYERASGRGGCATLPRRSASWNEAPRNFISLRSSFHYVGWEGLSRVEMNAQKWARLTAPLNPKGRSVFHFSIDMADDFIDGKRSA